MARAAKALIARLAYAALFIAAVPLLLVAWARRIEPIVPLPKLQSARLGLSLILAGCVLMLSAWHALRVYGGGWPMNPFPPRRFVRRGVYRFFDNPIYIGFALCCVGASLYYGSAAGLWLVSPITMLAMAALVLGYERHDLRARFGKATAHRPLIALPPAERTAPSAWDRASIYLLVFLPWLALYAAVQFLGIPSDAIESYLPFERGLPVLEWTEAIYATPYVIVAIIPLIARSQRALRSFALHGLVATFSVTLVYLLVPLIAPPRPFAPSSWLGEMLASERLTSNTVAAFPAFHVIWALLAARALARRNRRLVGPALLWAVAVAASCITTGMHSLLDVLAAFVAYAVVVSYRGIWHTLRRGAERLGNSWHEWRIGRVRIINHGFYAGMAAAVGVYIAGVTTQMSIPALVFIGLCVVLGAGAWAQWLEGSSALLRPFGYYGGIIGGIIGCVVVGLTGADPVLLLAGFALGAPWVQIWGRMRCLVQGCCHGAPASEQLGIRFLHARSRVAQIANLSGVPLHPTQLYSILSNLVTGLLLARLWLLGAAPQLILGLYLILNPIARFVEESYRGEPQTPIVGRLRIYQWLSITSLLAGVIATMLPAPPFPSVGDLLDTGYALAALLMFVVTGAAMGIDFPSSNVRFSRLAASEDSAALVQPELIER